MLGLYPSWVDAGVGSGWIIAFIATIHVLFSHASVGGAILFGWLANRSVRLGRPEYIGFIKRYGFFLLIFSYVLGSVTGPGIWFSATIATPRGISTLIHSFVWLWATEWVFFLIEIAGVYLLVYLAGKVDVRTHTRIAAIFALSSVCTLLIIVGILSFMLWPGQASWYEEGGVLSAFFGAGTMSQMFMRLFFMLAITAVVGGMVAGRIADASEKKSIAQALSALGLVGVIGGAACFFWYLAALPESAAGLLGALPACFKPLLAGSVAVCALYFAVTWLRPGLLTTPAAALMTLVVLVAGLAPGEMAREVIRKPWLAGQYMYANQVIGRDVPALGIKSEVATLREKGVLAVHPFIPENLRKVTDENRMEAGRMLAVTLCSNCHSLTDSGIRPLKNYFPPMLSEDDIAGFLTMFAEESGVMPAMPMLESESKALGLFIHTLVSPKAGEEAAK